MRACRLSTILKDIGVVVRLCFAPVVVVLQLGAGCVDLDDLYVVVNLAR